MLPVFSKSELRRLARAGAIRVGGRKLKDEMDVIKVGDFDEDGKCLVEVGKKIRFVLRIGGVCEGEVNQGGDLLSH